MIHKLWKMQRFAENKDVESYRTASFINPNWVVLQMDKPEGNTELLLCLCFGRFAFKSCAKKKIVCGLFEIKNS